METKYIAHRIATEVAWRRFFLSAISLKRALDFKAPFDFGAAERTDFEKPVAYPFRFADYPGYTHVKTKDDGVGAIDPDDELVTCVFRLKKRAGRE